ncbi:MULTISPECIES: hypothetical protein [unclassified Egicoccus]|uniref:hypothetical protein n=1 Tax=unclassified Egicoccus TaxID=2635606 RepID=UPI00359EAC2B
MRHLTSGRPGHRQPITITDPDTGRSYFVPQGGDEDDGDEDGDDEGDGSEEGDGEESEEEGSGEGEGEKTFTQADLDKAIDARIARERKRHERELRQAKRQAGKQTDNDGSDDADKKVTAATARAVKAEARAAAIAAGVSKDRAARFVGLADLDDIDSLLTDDGDVDTDAIEALVDDTLEEWPEFKPAEGKGKTGASGSDGHRGEDKQTKVWTRAEIAELDDVEYEKNREEIQRQIRKGLVK